MKALIFNSGLGKRMGALTAHNPKSLVRLYNDESIFERQIRLLQEAGIREIIITTGPYPEMLEEICRKPCYSNIAFTFVHNDLYEQTNYIFSMFKAKDSLLKGDFVLLHGDLVFDRQMLPSLLKDKRRDICLVDPLRKQPEKDFKGRIKDGFLREVSVEIFDEDCFAFQPLYKLSHETLIAWLKSVEAFVARGECSVYAENALNVISRSLHIHAKSFHGHFLEEVDNIDDLKRVNKGIQARDLNDQVFVDSDDWAGALADILASVNSRRPLFVVDRFIEKRINDLFPGMICFSDFTPNPRYEDITKGIRVFREEKCDAVVSIGGGSCIDVAKVIKFSLSSDLNGSTPTFRQTFQRSDVRHIAIPTTSGTGSEATQHAAIYLNGIKQSFSHFSLIPDYCILSSSFSLSVPALIKRSTCLDAYFQCVESTWSKKATKKSRGFAKKGIALFWECLDGYLANNEASCKKMLVVSHLSGKAINLSETTAGHALSYGLTSELGVPHGYAVALALFALTRRYEFNAAGQYPLTHKEVSVLLEKMDLPSQVRTDDPSVLSQLMGKISIERLSNFPYRLDSRTIEEIYSSLIC